MVKSNKGIETTIKYYMENPPDKLTPQRAIQRVAGYIYADGGTRSTPFFVNTNINYIEDFLQSLYTVYGEEVKKSLTCHLMVKPMDEEELFITRESLIEEEAYYVRRTNLPAKVRAYKSLFKQRHPVMMVVVRGPYGRKLKDDVEQAVKKPSLDFLATYINGDGYVQRRSDEKGYLCYVKESNPRKLKVLTEAVRELLAVKTYNIKLSENAVRVEIPLSFHSAAALAVYGCDKVLKCIQWYVSGRYFTFLTRIKDPNNITIRDRIVKHSAQLRELARLGYLRKTYESKGNRPSIYELTTKALILYQALKLAKPQTRRVATNRSPSFHLEIKLSVRSLNPLHPNP